MASRDRNAAWRTRQSIGDSRAELESSASSTARRRAAYSIWGVDKTLTMAATVAWTR
jgi:hypothetical protein